MNLRWDPRAIQDLREIRDYIAAHGSASSADRVRRHLRKRVERLRTNPFLGVATSAREIRVLAPTHYPYRIYYTVKPNEVVVLHIRHTARQAPTDLDQ